MHTKCAFSGLLEEPALRGIFPPSKMTLFLPIFNYKYCKSEIAFRKKSSLSTRKILAALSIQYSGGIFLFFLYKKNWSLIRFTFPISLDSSENIVSGRDPNFSRKDGLYLVPPIFQIGTLFLFFYVL